MNKEIKLNLEDEDVKKLITVLATNSYGMATFTVDENLMPKEIRLDGAIYDVKKSEHITELVHHFLKIEEAVKKVEDNYQSCKDLKEHIDEDVYNYHPRWISARKQYDMLPSVPGEIECPFEESTLIKTFHEWNQLLWVSTGSVDPICDISNDKKMSAKEYMERIHEITFKTDQDYFSSHISEFLSLYRGNADLTKLEEIALKVANNKSYCKEVDELADLAREEMMRLDYNVERKAAQKVNRRFYHPDLNAFIESAYYCTIYSKFGVTMKFDKKDNFPILFVSGKKYDFRTPNAKVLFLNSLSKRNSNRNSRQKTKKKRK